MWKRNVVIKARFPGREWMEVKVLANRRVRWQKIVDALCSLIEWDYDDEGDNTHKRNKFFLVFLSFSIFKNF